MRKLIVAAILALAVVPSASAAKPGPPPGLQWAPGVELSYTETVRDGLGNIVSQVHRDGIPAGAPFGDAVTTGAATAFDAPVTSRRLSACCSSSGSDTVSFELTKRSVLGFVAWRYHQVDHWCWQYPNITCFNVGSNFYDVDANGQVQYDSAGYGWYYTWAGGPFGGHYAHREGRIDNCVLHYGCIGSYYPYVDMWLNGNGAWSASGGGN